MNRRRARYSAQNILDYLDGNVADPERGIQSEIEGFESDNKNDLEPRMPPQDLFGTANDIFCSHRGW